MRLAPQALVAGLRLATYDHIDSTNAEALRLAAQGECGPVWIVARTQSAGRGRHGRTWVSEPGNLYASLLVSDPAPLRQAAELSFVAALAVHDAVADAAPVLRERLTLKWPNDLLGDRRKLSGILIESEGRAVAIGIGINCRHHPDEAAYPATDLAALNADVPPEDMFVALSRTMLSRLAQWDRGAGFAAIRAHWLLRSEGLGRDIRVRLNGRDVAGRFEDIDATGRLLLRHVDGGLETIGAGDVFPLSLSAAAAG